MAQSLSSPSGHPSVWVHLPTAVLDTLHCSFLMLCSYVIAICCRAGLFVSPFKVYITVCHSHTTMKGNVHVCSMYCRILHVFLVSYLARAPLDKYSILRAELIPKKPTSKGNNGTALACGTCAYKPRAGLVMGS